MKFFPLYFVLLTAVGGMLFGCRHELVLPESPDVIPVDTIPIDTVPPPPEPVDSADYTGVPCDPDTVYFQNQVLPLLISSCAQVGCHDAITHEEGVRMYNYDDIMEEVKAGQPNQSELYKVLSETGDKLMPPSPAAPFTTEQKNLIKKWIQQGALDNECNENYGGCETGGVTYTNFIYPLFANQCGGCHTSYAPSGDLSLVTYEQVKTSALSGKLYGALAHEATYKPMPDGGNKLSDCFLDKIKVWMDAGMPE